MFSLPQFKRNELKEWKEIQKSLVSRISQFTKKNKNSITDTHYHTLLNTASWTVWPLPTTLYDQL